MEKHVHHLRGFRRQSGFSQRDIARLIGGSTHWSVSRHERSPGTVTLETALAYEVIYRRPVAAIFRRTHIAIQQDIKRRAQALLAKLASSGSEPRDAQRKQSLKSIIATA